MRTTVGGTPYPVAYRGEIVRLAQITTNVQTHYFATSETDFDGQHYRDWLIIDEPIHYYRSFQADSAAIKLQNVDGQLEALLAAENFEGAAVILYDYFTGLGDGWTEAVELIRGLLSGRRSSSLTAAWDIVPTWDPASIEAPIRTVSHSCPWKYNSPECGHVGAPATCDKTYATCNVTMSNAHRFGGFLQITAALQQLYPPASPNQLPATPAGWPVPFQVT